MMQETKKKKKNRFKRENDALAAPSESTFKWMGVYQRVRSYLNAGRNTLQPYIILTKYS